jgi:hypothetical protein
MAGRSPDTFRAPAWLKLSREDEAAAFFLLNRAIIESEPKPRDFQSLAWCVAMQAVRDAKPKKRGAPPKWSLEEEFVVVSAFDKRLKEQGKSSGDRKVIERIAAEIQKIPYFAKFTPKRLRAVYYDRRDAFYHLQSFLSANSAE